LARAADDSAAVASAKEIPQLDHTLELSEALEQMRRHNANFALVKTPANWSGILDLEDILAKLLAPAP
jgi:CBS domain containing-hemolysin-like protein